MKLFQVKNEIEQRRKNAKKIRSKINEFCNEKYGIENFFAIADKHLGCEDNFQICLARQIPTPNIEHIALYLASREWGMKPLFLSLIRDSYPQNEKNGYKKSLVNSPMIFRGRNGKIVAQNIKFSKEKALQNAILSEIKNVNGISLPEMHWSLMKQAITHDLPVKKDMSDFFSEVLSCAKKNLPRKIFVKNGKHEQKIDFCNYKLDEARPPADWYYIFHLLLFLEGRYGLASTVDENQEVINWFRINNQKIKDICGFYPLILDIPLKVNADGFCSSLNEIPKKSLSGNGFMSSISLSKQSSEMCFFEIMKHYETELIVRA